MIIGVRVTQKMRTKRGELLYQVPTQGYQPQREDVSILKNSARLSLYWRCGSSPQMYNS